MKEQAKDDDVTIKKLIEIYEEKVGAIKSWERSKQAVLNSWKNRAERKEFASSVTSVWLNKA